MVQKFQSPVRVYKHPFELVMKAYERRFPKCPQMPIVLDCDIIKDESLENGAKRNTSRRCKLAVDAPYIFKKLIGVDFVYFLQHNYLDMSARTLSIEAVNESFSSRIEIFERCRYYAHPDNAEWTCFDQTATLDIKNFFGFEHSMEKMGMKQYTQTTLKGKEIIEFFISQLEEEGITHVERWVPPLDAPKSPTPEKEQHQHHDILLDGDFIARNLGQLSPMQESKLLELRKMLDGVDDLERVPSYQTILRFLSARDWHVSQAFAMLRDSLQWRKEHRIDALLEEYTKPAVVVEHFPGGWHHQDKDGRPIYILRLGHMDVKGLLKSLGMEGLLKLALHICEEGIQKINESAERLDKPVLNWSLLVDLEGLSMRHLWRPGIKALLYIIETVERNYPETMGRVLVVRAPRVFPIAWTIVSAFIDEHTRSKFLFYGPDCAHMTDGLAQYIDEEIVPDFLGGPCKTMIHEGGLVPKTLYKMNSLEDHDDDVTIVSPASGSALAPVAVAPMKRLSAAHQHDHQNLYKSVDLKAGFSHELLIRNEDPKSVLTWDFDVMRNDLHFTLYRVTQELPQKNDDAVSYFDLQDFVEGVNYFREEPTLVCRHKESVQGSHVMHHNDSYLMHWFSPSGAQLNLFYEVLSSVNYKGSMTSLQSAFSSNSSAASSVQSR
ncbi:protein real-time isoform X1 [Drosophila guanche]|uniref:Protein real-time n=2 Tax=Drosophila guanche TaxID=7266 RepID=A0A3B0JYM8_DROGU|nr:protein real-time isoform X1 [Drosophila guanche]SPP86173.1 blast:Protein real-time [Drosophila guanche]